jgi:DNA-directed RNA polymerase specialized sigma subunit
MVIGGNRETNLVAMVAVKANSIKSIFERHSISHAKQCRREKLVIDLYYNQQKNVRQIAQEARISFRDITATLKKKRDSSQSW